MKSKKRLRFWIIAGVVVLPFHYVPYALMVFPKDHLFFNYTFITQSDVAKLIYRYNNASNIFEQQAIAQEPLARKLFEKGIIGSSEREEHQSSSSYTSNTPTDYKYETQYDEPEIVRIHPTNRISFFNIATFTFARRDLSFFQFNRHE